MIYKFLNEGFSKYGLEGTTQPKCLNEGLEDFDDENYESDDYYNLVGQDGNAFALMGYTAKALRREGLGNLVKEMQNKAMSSDYNNLVVVCNDYVQMANEAHKRNDSIGGNLIDNRDSIDEETEISFKSNTLDNAVNKVGDVANNVVSHAGDIAGAAAAIVPLIAEGKLSNDDKTQRKIVQTYIDFAKDGGYTARNYEEFKQWCTDDGIKCNKELYTWYQLRLGKQLNEDNKFITDEEVANKIYNIYVNDGNYVVPGKDIRPYLDIPNTYSTQDIINAIKNSGKLKVKEFQGANGPTFKVWSNIDDYFIMQIKANKVIYSANFGFIMDEANAKNTKYFNNFKDAMNKLKSYEGYKWIGVHLTFNSNGIPSKFKFEFSKYPQYGSMCIAKLDYDNSVISSNKVYDFLVGRNQTNVNEALTDDEKEALIDRNWVKINTLTAYPAAGGVADEFEINLVTKEVRNSKTGNILPYVDQIGSIAQGDKTVAVRQQSGKNTNLLKSRLFKAAAKQYPNWK